MNNLDWYEREEAKPSIEVARKIADLLEVSLDYLTGKVDAEVDKVHTIDALVRDAKARFAYAS